jgi:hypothetical protein
MPFPVLKKGTAFLATETGTPVRGFRPVRLSRNFTKKSQTPAVRPGHRVPLRQSGPARPWLRVLKSRGVEFSEDGVRLIKKPSRR